MMLFASFHLSSVGCESSKAKKSCTCPQGIHGPSGKTFNKKKLTMLRSNLCCASDLSGARGVAGLWDMETFFLFQFWLCWLFIAA